VPHKPAVRPGLVVTQQDHDVGRLLDGGQTGNQAEQNKLFLSDPDCKSFARRVRKTCSHQFFSQFFHTTGHQNR
jgi:hypothetical protein